MNKTEFLDRCREIFAAGKIQDTIIWQMNEKYGIEIDHKLQEIVGKRITMDFSWFQKTQIQESGFTIAQEHIFSLGIMEWGADSDTECKLTYNEKEYKIITNPLYELNGYVTNARSWKGKALPRIKTQPLLLVPLELGIKIKALGFMP